SVRQFQHPDLVAEVTDVLRQTRLDPTCLHLELTEGVMMKEVESTARTLHGLKALGSQLAIDDFGTGYSSLNYLKRFRPDTLKMDRSFIGGLEQDHEDAAIVRAIIGLADALGIRMVAEGVETTAQAQTLCTLGCGLAQGYHFARPLPAAGAATLLANSDLILMEQLAVAGRIGNGPGG
nr:EAL domain-containing protein [Chloroflexia bacterium]